MTRACVIALALVGWLSWAAVGFADWSQWRGPNRDGVAAKVKLPSTWPKDLQRDWQVVVGEGHASPLVVGGRVYVFARQQDQEVVLCLKLADGKEIWRKSYAAPYEINPPAAGHGKGPKSTPLLSDGRLFTFGISGILACWDAECGAPLWQKDFSKQFKHTSPLYGTAMSPLVDEGKLVIHVGGHDQGAVVALDAATGAVEWSWKGDGPAYASPVVAEFSATRQVITQTQNCCVGIDLHDGKLLWKIPFRTDYDQNSVTPVIYEESVIFSGYGKGIDRYRVEKDGDEWRTDKIWENKEVSLYMSSPVVRDEHLFGFSHRQKGQLFALDITTGKTLWVGEGRLADNAALVRTGPLVWALTTQSELIVFRDSDKQFEQVARYKVAESPTWAHPVILADSILIKDETKLTQWRLRDAAPAAESGAAAAF